MALTQRSWNGPEQESQNSPQSVKGRRETENRFESHTIETKVHFHSPQEVMRQQHPRPESIQVFAGLASPFATLFIVVGGKTIELELSRKQLIGIAADALKGLQKMEPGK
jgi:hypothetical protein